MATARCANTSCALGGTVYFAERTQGPAGKIYHKSCLRCGECAKVVAPGSFQDHDGEPFCKACHGKLFGTRGYGVGHQSLVGEYRTRAVTPPLAPPAVSPNRSNTNGSLPPPRPITPEPAAPSRRPLPTPAGRPTATTEARPPPPPVSPKPMIPPKPGFSNGGAQRTSFGAGRSSLGGGSDHCPRCGAVVYAAEAVLASGKKWHKRCLRCTSCSTTLSSTNLVEKEGQPFCQKCHTKTSLAEQGLMTRPGLF